MTSLFVNDWSDIWWEKNELLPFTKCITIIMCHSYKQESMLMWHGKHAGLCIIHHKMPSFYYRRCFMTAWSHWRLEKIVINQVGIFQIGNVYSMRLLPVTWETCWSMYFYDKMPSFHYRECCMTTWTLWRLEKNVINQVCLFSYKQWRLSQATSIALKLN